MKKVLGIMLVTTLAVGSIAFVFEQKGIANVPVADCCTEEAVVVNTPVVDNTAPVIAQAECNDCDTVGNTPNNKQGRGQGGRGQGRGNRQGGHCNMGRQQNQSDCGNCQ